jgi:hypothetical protein
MSVADAAAGLSSAQRAVARTVESVLAARGMPSEVIAAALVNAVAESGLNPNAVGDSGASVGLFQLHERGAGKGMTVAARKDPVTNTKRIAEEYDRYGGKIRAAYAAGERDIGKLAGMWSTHIERPADKAGEASRRAARAAKLFPGLVSTGSRVAVFSEGVNSMGALIGLALLGGLFVYRKATQARGASNTTSEQRMPR